MSLNTSSILKPEVVDIRNPKNLPEPFSDETYKWIESSLYLFIIPPLSILGIVTNIINIKIFHKQGILSNSPTVTLTALAVADFSGCVFHIWHTILNVMHKFTDLSQYIVNIFDLMIFTSGRPASMLSQVTCVATAFAAFERMISVVLPFKVKEIFSPKRTAIVMILVYALHVFLFIPAWITDIPHWVVNPKTNRTWLKWINDGLVSATLWQTFFYTNQITIRFSMITGVVVCNGVIFWKVNLSQKFRNRNSDTAAVTKTRNTQGSGNAGAKDIKSGETGSGNNKDTKLLRMITAISILFVTCYIPYLVHATIFYVVYNGMDDVHYYVSYTVRHVVFLMQVINSSGNIFIYYTMSSRFKEDFKNMFRKEKK